MKFYKDQYINESNKLILRKVRSNYPNATITRVLSETSWITSCPIIALGYMYIMEYGDSIEIRRIIEVNRKFYGIKEII